MQEFQNALYINPFDLTNAVIFDRAWVQQQLSDAGLTIAHVTPPNTRGFQWRLRLEKRPGTHCEFPEDIAPRGIQRPPAS